MNNVQVIHDNNNVQVIYRKLYDRYGPVLRPFGFSKNQIINEDHIVSSLCIDNCSSVIVCESIVQYTTKIVVAPDIVLNENDEIIVVDNKKSKFKLFTLNEYKMYNLDEYYKICKHIDYILYRKKEIEIERKMKRINEDF
jgi:hypothetical protein